MAALVAALQMAAECCCAAAFDGPQHTLLYHGQRCGMRPAELLTMDAHNVGDFQGRSHAETAPYGWGSRIG